MIPTLIHRVLQGSPSAVFMGDFNMRGKEGEDVLAGSGGNGGSGGGGNGSGEVCVWRDAWLETHPKQVIKP